MRRKEEGGKEEEGREVKDNEEEGRRREGGGMEGGKGLWRHDAGMMGVSEGGVMRKEGEGGGEMWLQEM